MSFKGTLVFASLFAGGVLSAYSFFKPESAMAAEAFAAGDYENSVRLYERVRNTAAANKDEEAWISSTLALARAKVRLGDTAGARQLFDEFVKRHPAHSPGLLKGELLAAEGSIPEAEQSFREYAFSTRDPKERAAAELAMAYLELRFGSAAAAVETLAKLERDPHVGGVARSLRIYGLIRAGRPGEAKKLIAAIPAGKQGSERLRLRILSLLADLREGKAANFASEWEALRPELKARPDPLIMDTLKEAAQLALRDNSPPRAAQLLSAAYDFADSDETRKELLIGIFNCQAAVNDAKSAAETASRYAECFPDSTDCARLLCGAGRLLVKDGDPKAALKYFDRVIYGREFLAAERRDAAHDAASAAERCGDRAAAERYYNAMLAAADSPADRSTALIAFAEYLMRCKDYPYAEKMLRRAAESPERGIADRAGQLLIRALIPQEKFSPALAIAERLKSSPDTRYAEFGLFHTAFLAEKLGDAAAARKRYQEFVGKYPKSEFLHAARFSAALIAVNSGDYPAATREFLGYAADYPDDPARGNALFWAVRSLCFAGDIPGARNAFGGIGAPGPAYYAAALQLLESLRLTGKPEAGLEFWDSLDRGKCGDGEQAALLLERAYLLRDCGRKDEALQTLSEPNVGLIERFPTLPLIADAELLAGDLNWDRREYQKALESFRKALQKRPSRIFGEVVKGRIGDALLKQYESTSADEALREAAGIFEELSGKSDTPTIRLQSLYKLGYCRQELRDLRGAVAAYEQTLLCARVLKNQGIAFDPEWCGRSYYAALKILRESRFSNRKQIGLRIIDSFRKLGIEGAAEDAAASEKEFR